MKCQVLISKTKQECVAHNQTKFCLAKARNNSFHAASDFVQATISPPDMASSRTFVHTVLETLQYVFKIYSNIQSSLISNEILMCTN